MISAATVCCVLQLHKNVNCFGATGCIAIYAVFRFHKIKTHSERETCTQVSLRLPIVVNKRRKKKKEIKQETQSFERTPHPRGHTNARAIWHQFQTNIHSSVCCVLRLEFRVIWIWIENFSNGMWNAISHSSGHSW